MKKPRTKLSKKEIIQAFVVKDILPDGVYPVYEVPRGSTVFYINKKSLFQVQSLKLDNTDQFPVDTFLLEAPTKEELKDKIGGLLLLLAGKSFPCQILMAVRQDIDVLYDYPITGQTTWYTEIGLMAYENFNS